MSAFIAPSAGIMVGLLYLIVAEVTTTLPSHAGIAVVIATIAMFAWSYSPLPDGHTFGHTYGGGNWGFGPEEGDSE